MNHINNDFFKLKGMSKSISALAIEMAAFFVRAYAQKSYNG
jgi:hypothetical protein